MSKENKARDKELATFEEVCIEITSREDEKKWKRFLHRYFPNHYASRILGEDLVVTITNKRNGYVSKLIGVSPRGFGWLSHMLAHYGGSHEIKDFNEFKKTACYKTIRKQGVFYGEGSPSVVHIPLC